MRPTYSKIILSLALTSCTLHLSGAVCEKTVKRYGFPFYKQRPQILNIPRRVAGELQNLFRPNLEYVNGNISLLAEYTRSFNTEELGQYVFFNGKDTMTFGPAGDTTTDVAAREFLLGENFTSEVTTTPRVQNFILQFAFRLGLDEWIKNLYFDLHAPFVWTKWDLNLEEKILSSGTGYIPQGELGNNNAQIKAPFKNVINAWNGQRTVAEVEDTMNFGRVDGGKTELKLADMEFVVGYNIVNKDWVHFGLNFRVIVPTGNNPASEYLFEPIAGDADHTAIGPGIDGHFKLHNTELNDSYSFYYFAHIYHMLKQEQPRTFDLKENGVGSRYLLFKRFDDLNLYENTIVRGPNLLTFPVDVKINIEAEAAFIFNYKYCNWSLDIGYDVWGRTSEEISLIDGTPAESDGTIISDDSYRFGVKGNTNTVDEQLQPDEFTGDPTANYTASKATIKGTNAEVDIDPTTGEPTQVFLKIADLDIEGAEAPGTFSQKVFFHIGYEWPSCDLSPFIGLGGEAEFSGKRGTALSQWGIWMKGGFYFE